MLAKKIFILLFIVIFSSSVLSVNSAVRDKYVPEWYISWDGEQKNVMDNFWDNLNPTYSQTQVDPDEDADVYGWYTGTFFGLKNWEREVCSFDLSNEIKSVRSTSSNIDTVDIYTTTLTVSAKKTTYYNITLYEVAWFIRPMDNSVQYRVYLKDNANNKEFFIGSVSSFSSASAMSGASGYSPKYLTLNFTEVILEYKAGSYSANFTSKVIG